MSGAKQQLTRMLALVPYLQGTTDLSVDEVAATFKVKPDRIIADLQVLYMCGLPGQLPGDLIEVDMEAFDKDGDRIVRLDNAEYLSRPLRLDSSEAAALVLALRQLRESSPEPSRDVIDRALAKLESAAAEAVGVAHVLDVPEHRVRSARFRTQLQAALDAGRQVRIDYLVPSRDETTTRTVDPLALLTSDGFDYLDAWCHLAEARRSFRLDRIVELEDLGSPAQRHDVAPRDLSQGLFEAGPDDLVAVLVLSPRARWVAEYYPVQEQRELPDGGLQVTLRVGDPRWLVRLLHRLAPDAELVEPAELRGEVLAAAQATLSNYQGHGVD